MAAMSGWALPGAQKAELNRDEYSRPSFEDRATAWVALIGAGVVSPAQVAAAERLASPTGSPTAAILEVRP